MNRRVVVTGIGVLTPNAKSKEEFCEALKLGKSGIETITRFDTLKLTTKFAGEVKDFQPLNYMDRHLSKRMDRVGQLAFAASMMAVKDSKLDIKAKGGEKTMVAMGTIMPGHACIMAQYETYIKKGPMRINPFTATASFPDSGASNISMALGASGQSLSISTACSSGLDAVGYGFRAIKKGEADIAVTGGSDAPISPFNMTAFCVIHALSKRNKEPEKASRPFDKTRDGFVLSEGAGVLVLEEFRHALKRKAHIYAEIVGYGSTCDAYHITMPESNGFQANRAVNMALREARINPDRVDYINAHGTSTPMNDKNETNIIKKVFGKRAYKIPISSTKSMIGHLMGGAGSVELIATLLCMQYNFIHPTINYKYPDPECDLDYVPNVAREKKIRVALSNSFGFGGKNAALIIKKL